MSQLAKFWCSRRLLVTVEGPQGKSVIPLARPFARVGRQEGSDIVLSSPWVARRSLYLHATDEGVFCFYLQPEETHEERLGFWLAPGEPLMVGPYRLSACLEGDQPGPAPALMPLDDWGSAPPPYPLFQVYSGGTLRDKRRFRARLSLIGRRHECALQIKGQQVSAFHGCLYWQYPRLWYVDLVSSNGTMLNGRSTDCAEVRIGDQLEIGEFTLLFQRLSKGGTSRVEARTSLRKSPNGADLLPPDFEEDLPPDLEGQSSPELSARDASEGAEISPVIPLETPEPSASEPAASRSDTELAALASAQQTRQELATLQRQVEELTQLNIQVGKNAAQQLADETREAFERERQRIAGELERRGSELVREKRALEMQWQTASRELASQVNQLRDEATLLARQRQAMEQSRLLWDAQRTELERQLRVYAEQLHKLEHSAGPGLPAPATERLPSPTGQSPHTTLEVSRLRTAGSEESAAATGMVVAADQRTGELTPRSHVVDSRVEAGAAAPSMSRLPAFGASARLAAPSPNEPPPPADDVLEGSLAGSDEETVPRSVHAAPPSTAERPIIKGRKSPAKARQAFDRVTDQMVAMEQGRRRTMMVLGIAVAVGVVGLAVAMVVAALLLR